MDAVISQEALCMCRIRAALSEAYRFLKKGGRLAFHRLDRAPRLAATDPNRVLGIAAQTSEFRFLRSYAPGSWLSASFPKGPDRRVGKDLSSDSRCTGTCTTEQLHSARLR